MRLCGRLRRTLGQAGAPHWLRAGALIPATPRHGGNAALPRAPIRRWRYRAQITATRRMCTGEQGRSPRVAPDTASQINSAKLPQMQLNDAKIKGKQGKTRENNGKTRPEIFKKAPTPRI